MALSFGESKGSALKNSVDAFVFKNGDNKMRIVGNILARYVYWVEGENKKNIPMECLAFDRNAEAFNNKEKDWVPVFYPDLKCQWSYMVQCIDDGKIKVVNLKKKLWQQIITAAKDLGDPTNPDTGWDICFERAKTGPNVFNVEYTLQVLKCQKAVRPLTAAEKAIMKDLKSMDEVMPRPTPESQKEFLERIRDANGPKETDKETVAEEFDVS